MVLKGYTCITTVMESRQPQAVVTGHQMVLYIHSLSLDCMTWGPNASVSMRTKETGTQDRQGSAVILPLGSVFHKI